MADESRAIVVYVDENEGARHEFATDAYYTQLFGEVLILAPEPRLSDMIDVLLGHQFDALVSDFRLADASPVEYDGSELVSAFLAVRAGFPCFIRTSYDDEALHAADDVNRVYSKDVSGDSPGRGIFERIDLQIKRQRQQVADGYAELEGLLAIEAAALSASDIDRIVELDSRLESYLGADHSTPKNVKLSLFKDGLRARQGELIRETESLLDEIRSVLSERGK